MPAGPIKIAATQLSGGGGDWGVAEDVGAEAPEVGDVGVGEEVLPVAGPDAESDPRSGEGEEDDDEEDPEGEADAEPWVRGPPNAQTGADHSLDGEPVLTAWIWKQCRPGALVGATMLVSLGPTFALPCMGMTT